MPSQHWLRTLAIVVAILTWSTNAEGAPVTCRFEQNSLLLYTGRIGVRHVRATLAFHRNDVNGEVSAAAGFTDIAVRGDLNGRRLRLHSPGAKRTLLFSGRFATCEALAGTWIDPQSGERRQMRLYEDAALPDTSLAHRYATAGARNDTLVDANVRAFRAAVLRGDRSAVIALIGYPLRVNFAPHALIYRNAAALRNAYNDIFTPKVRAAIGAAVPADLFARDQGIMLGGGVVWFNRSGRAFAINP